MTIRAGSGFWADGRECDNFVREHRRGKNVTRQREEGGGLRSYGEEKGAATVRTWVGKPFIFIWIERKMELDSDVNLA